MDLTKRSSGVLLHITSLPGPNGIGDLGPGAFHFVDWLVGCGQSVWQLLPTTPGARQLVLDVPWIAMVTTLVRRI